MSETRSIISTLSNKGRERSVKKRETPLRNPMGDYFIDKSLKDRANTTMSSFTPNDKTYTKVGKELTNQELAKRIMNLTAMKTF